MTTRAQLEAELAHLLAPLLARALAPVAREQLAEALDQLATRQRALAAAALRQATRRGQGRLPGAFVRVERIAKAHPRGHSQDRDVEAGARNRAPGEPRLRLYIGKALWRALGSPGWIRIRRDAAGIALLPAHAAGEGCYRLVVGGGMPRAWADGARAQLAPLADGSYAATVEAGVLIIGAPLP